jgi:hypothetical protein
MLGFSENASAVEMPESGVKSRQTSIFKEFKIHDKNFIHLPRQDLLFVIKSLKSS